MASPANPEVVQLKRRFEQIAAQADAPSSGGYTPSSGRSNSNRASLSRPPPTDLVATEASEGSELEKLSRLLATQTQYNNSLLAQLQEAETNALAAQREQAERKQALRQAMGTCEALREDVVSMKRKQAQALETAQRCEEEAARAQTEAGILQRELEAHRAFVDEAKLDAARWREDAEDLKRDLDRALNEQQALRAELDAVKEEEKVRAAERRADTDAAMREAAQARTRVGPLEAELRAERARNEELTEAARAAAQELANAKAELADVKAAAAVHRERADAAAQVEEELLNEIQEKTRVANLAEEQIQAARELVAAAENAKRLAEKRAAEVALAQRKAEDEISELKSQLEAVGNDLAAHAGARRSDREHLSAKLAQTQQQLEDALRAVAEVERAASQAAARREQDFADARRAAAESHGKLQEENLRLNDLLQGLQRDTALASAEFQGERDAYEERIADAVRRLRAAESALNNRDANSESETAALREKAVEAQAALTQRTRLHVDSLGALESTIRSLALELQRVQQAHDGLVDQVETMRAASKDSEDRLSRPLEEWHLETRKAMAQLAEDLTEATQAERAAREAQSLAERARDEDRTRVIVLEEERARLEEELGPALERAAALERALDDRKRAVRSELDSHGAARADVEAINRRLQDQLDRANENARALQEEVLKANEAKEEALARAREKAAQHEDKSARAKAEALAAEAARDAALAEASLAKRRLEAAAADVARLQRELDDRQNAAATGPNDLSESQELTKRAALLSENMRRQGDQLASTKKLLELVTAQRSHLQDENKALKQELDELLAKTMAPNTQLVATTRGHHPHEPLLHDAMNEEDADILLVPREEGQDDERQEETDVLTPIEHEEEDEEEAAEHGQARAERGSEEGSAE